MSDSDAWWYNFRTGKVEQGLLSPAIDRAGPFASEQEAAQAPEILRQRSEQWAEEDRAESGDEPR